MASSALSRSALSLAFAPAPTPASSSKNALDLGIGIGIGVFFFLLLAVLVITQSLRKFKWRAPARSLLGKLGWKGKVDDEEADRDPERRLADLKLPSRYSYRDLSAATKGFSSKELIGSGGFGEVYKAHLSQDGSTVAVKKIFEHPEQGERQFLAEIAIIGRISHRNLVQLKGWCYEKGKMLLLYDYMPNGSLDRHLLGKSEKVLQWHYRYDIVKGVAAGLFYLHEGWEKRIIHNDVKPSNVLLDADFNPRLSDFGLARLIEDSNLAKTITLAGTLGFVAPELHYTGKANEKSDVYSFGVLLLTVACGRPPLDDTLPDQETLLNWVWRMQEEGRLMDAADPKLAGDYNDIEMICLLQLGLICCYPDPDARPTMRYCNQVLHGDAPIPRLASSKPLLFYSMHPLPISAEFESGFSLLEGR
ncbi:hypothetical protein O6H91_06G121000 [Diphasiastrum complanatum]|uniref:Uncharacterized protein n=2 Tax=Diphasiastrum complanatum TaxID=34168 RepID=A0ACC2DJ19_DIPCM|nr:hypothetical protein O6H91_06G121000 [Diphasiastrum complanatum]KAJ7553982.1 hypothetical protein O6H91_06G121000 [Diphasiastrum complanatum]